MPRMGRVGWSTRKLVSSRRCGSVGGMSKASPAIEKARGTILGLGAFEKISAVEGLRLIPR